MTDDDKQSKSIDMDDVLDELERERKSGKLAKTVQGQSSVLYGTDEDGRVVRVDVKSDR